MIQIMSHDSQSPENQSQAISLFVQQLYHGCPRVFITPAILIFNIAVFLILLSQGAGLTGQNLSVYIEFGANLGSLTKDDQWWRLFTALFLHYGVIHLAFNMWALWDAGRLTERLFGHKNFAWIYFSAGLLASLSSLYWNQDNVASAGASGAVFGVFGALIGYLIRQKNTVPSSLQKQLLKNALIFTGFALFFGLTVPAIDNAAHIGGLLGGLVLGALLAKPLTSRRPAMLPAILAHAGSVVVIVVAIIMAPPPAYNYADQKQAELIIRDFIAKDEVLRNEWQKLMKALQSDPRISEKDIRQKLDRQLSQWIDIQTQTRPRGMIQEKAETRILLLNEYAGYQINNIYYLIKFLETQDELQMQYIRENSKNIKRVVKQINDTAS